MYRQEVLVLLILCLVSIQANPDRGLVCIRNLKINGTNLITDYRKQILVLGVTHLGCQACRNQAIRYNDLYRDLEHHNIREPDVRLVLVNEETATQYLPGMNYGYYGQRLNNLIFGRCGYLVYSQTYPQSNLEEETNYQQLLRIIIAVAKYKQPCPTMCS
ncbi:hypothetical protein I4U23_024598 [Adineta vaga]|nr:hypothetical protein I4U23_024598 [Adineta vaga]